jgi:hypothetical protein
LQPKLGPVLQRGDSFKGAADAGGVWDAGKLGHGPAQPVWLCAVSVKGSKR